MPVILDIDAKAAMDSGLEIQRAARTVYLIGEVPAEFLSRAEEQETLDDEPESE